MAGVIKRIKVHQVERIKSKAGYGNRRHVRDGRNESCGTNGIWTEDGDEGMGKRGSTRNKFSYFDKKQTKKVLDKGISETFLFTLGVIE